MLSLLGFSGLALALFIIHLALAWLLIYFSFLEIAGNFQLLLLSLLKFFQFTLVLLIVSRLSTEAATWVVLLFECIWLACDFIKKRLQHKCFPVKFPKFLRTAILRNICERLLVLSNYSFFDVLIFRAFSTCHLVWMKLTVLSSVYLRSVFLWTAAWPNVNSKV